MKSGMEPTKQQGGFGLMKIPKNMTISGYIEKSDIFEFKELLRGVPIYSTKKGCLRQLRGYENTSVVCVKIKIQFYASRS